MYIDFEQHHDFVTFGLEAAIVGLCVVAWAAPNSDPARSGASARENP
jgi:hypothetical protein